VAIRRMLSRSAEQGRSDDVESTMRHRIEVFQRQTYPLCRFYAQRGLLVDVDAEQPPDRVTAAILEKLAEVEGSHGDDRRGRPR
jgi:adenylate kinase